MRQGWRVLWQLHAWRAAAAALQPVFRISPLCKRQGVLWLPCVCCLVSESVLGVGSWCGKDKQASKQARKPSDMSVYRQACLDQAQGVCRE